MPRPFLVGTVLAITALAASACGSTANVGPGGSQGTVGNAIDADHDAEGGLGARPSATERIADSDAPGEVPVGDRGQVPDRRPATEGRGEPQPGSTQPEARGGQAAVPGMTDAEVRIGFLITEDANVNEAAGVEGITQGDQREYLRIVVEDMNARGGIAGHDVVPVIHVRDPYRDAQRDAQAACALFTEDVEVFAVAVESAKFDTLPACLSGAGVPYLSSGLSISDTERLRRFPGYFEASTFAFDRMVTVLVPALEQQDYFTGSGALDAVKVGILRYDVPAFQRVSDDHLKPALSRAGVEVAAEAAVSQAASPGELGTVAAQINNAVLRFSTSGVTHVIILEAAGDLSFFFMNAAENQNYRPRYGLHSQNGGQLLVGNVPQGQLQDAVAIGWSSLADVPADKEPRPNAQRQRCEQIMEDADQQFADRNALAVAVMYCDIGEFIRTAAEVAGQPLNRQRLVESVGRLDRRFQAGETMTTRFFPGRKDGVASYRHVAFFEECTCFRYTSEPQHTG